MGHRSSIGFSCAVKLIVLSWVLVNFAIKPVIANPFAEQTLRVAFHAQSFPELSKEDLEISVKMLSVELGRDIAVATEVALYDDVGIMRRDFEQGKVNFVVVSTMLLATEFNTQLFADGFRLVKSDAQDHLVIVVQKGIGTSQLKDFYGKRLVLSTQDPITDLYIDYLAWSNFKKSYKSSFKQMPREKKAQQLVLKLFFDQADITCVYRHVLQIAAELNPQLRDKVEIIEQLDGIPSAVGLFHKNVPITFREQVIDKALQLASTPRGQQMLELFRSDKAIRSTPEDLIQAKKLLALYES